MIREQAGETLFTPRRISADVHRPLTISVQEKVLLNRDILMVLS
jgi:hypothetical protein